MQIPEVNRLGIDDVDGASKPLEAALELLAADAALPPRYADHQLKGQYKEYRDCHLRPDLVLVYGKRNADTLELVRIGSHAQLGL